MIILILAIICMRFIQSVYSKQTALFMPQSIKSYINYTTLYLFLAAAFATVILFAERNFYGCDTEVVLISAFSGIFLTIGVFCGIKALTCGTMVLNSVFATSGLIIPCVLGIFTFSEPISVLQTVCIAGVLISATLLIQSAKKTTANFSFKTLVFLVISFFANGMTMFCQKLFGFLKPNGNVSLFSLLTFLIPAVLLFVFGLFVPSDNKESKKLPKKLIKCAVWQALAVFIIQQFVTELTPKMSSAVLFTLVNGSATVITAAVGTLMYREKMTVKNLLGIIIGLGALIVINIK